jgi:formate hydrogenlyase subunit 3/multisubunit Na+/H+ antiporter MnhD subunit
VCGIIGVVLCFTVVLGVVLGVLALVFGLIGRGRAKRGEATNRGQATAGVVLGSIALVATAGVIGLYVWLANTDEFKNYQDCLRSANTQQERSACEDEFNQNFGN